MAKKRKKKVKSQKNETSIAGVEQIEELIKEQVEKNKGRLTDSEKQDQIEALKKVFIEGETPLEVLDLPENFAQMIYKQAYDQYNFGLYKEANQAFRLLCLLDPQAARYHLGLAATNHQMGNYHLAIPIYFASYFLDTTSPAPLYYISDCYMNLKLPDCAYFALELAADVCGDGKKYGQLKTRCYQSMKQIRQNYGDPKKQSGNEKGKEKSNEPQIFSQLRAEAEKDL